jgi:hypothetical protein
MGAVRDEKGRFATGNKGGPGRPSRAVELDYLNAVREAVPPERLRKIARRAGRDAENGDPKARRWLSDVLIGRRANTAVALTVAEESGLINFGALADEELESYADLYGRMLNGDALSADDALANVRLMTKSLRSSERPDREWDA